MCSRGFIIPGTSAYQAAAVLPLYSLIPVAPAAQGGGSGGRDRNEGANWPVCLSTAAVGPLWANDARTPIRASAHPVRMLEHATLWTVVAPWIMPAAAPWVSLGPFA